jgi:hypothetical protein
MVCYSLREKHIAPGGKAFMEGALPEHAILRSPRTVQQ